MGKLSDLFKYKDKVEIKNPETGEVLQEAWVRILGDDDLKEAYRWARIASSETRAKLRDKTSVEYRDEIAQLDNVPKENLVALILASRESDFFNEASLVIVREELPSLEDITDRADAPSLEDQERLDRLTEETEERYKNAIQEFVDTRLNEVGAELLEKTFEEVLELAKGDLANIQALEAFVSELNDQKAFRGTYDDKLCREPSFSSIEDFKAAHSITKEQLINKYKEIELDTDTIKN